MTASIHHMELLDQRLVHAHRSAISEELVRRGLGEVGHPMLLTILKYSGESDPDRPWRAQRELADQLRISPAAVANSLKSLERGGYIIREPGQQDARRNRVLLTEKGRQAVEGCQAAFEAVARRMLEGFSGEEREQLLSFRRRMLDNLSRPPREELEKEGR